jgi:glycine/D-amino acid oxidase-like deaminating enzyme
MPQHYRVIVIGCGAIGAATAYWQLMHRTGGLVIAERNTAGIESLAATATCPGQLDVSRPAAAPA